MTRRTILHQRFYAQPTRENLEELERVLIHAAEEHIMTHREVEFIILKAREYLDEVSDE